MKIRIGMVMAVAMAAAMLCSLSAVYAYEGCDAGKDGAKCQAHCKKMTEELKLTPQQKEQLSNDCKGFSSKSKEIMEKMKSVRADLKSELDKPAPDKARIDSLIAQTKDLVGQQMQNKVDKVMAMKNVLTPEQFKKMRESKKDGKYGKHDKHGKGDKGGDPACGM